MHALRLSRHRKGAGLLFDDDGTMIMRTSTSSPVLYRFAAVCFSRKKEARPSEPTPGPEEEPVLGATQDAATPRSSAMSSETGSEDSEGGGGEEESKAKAEGGETSDSAVVDDRDETMGVSLGPVTQGHLVGVRFECLRLCVTGFPSSGHHVYSFGAVVSSETHRPFAHTNADTCDV